MRIKDAIDGKSLRGNFPLPVAPNAPPDVSVMGRLDTSIETRPATEEEKLNELEKAFLRHLRGRGHDWVGVQCITLKLAHRLTYTPDFWVLQDGRLLAYDTKGEHIWEDAIVKMKTAARIFPLFSFFMVTKEKGKWIEKELMP